MGAIIEVFPRRDGARRRPEAQALRALARVDDALRVRTARLEDLAAIRALQRAAGPAVAPLSLRQLESRRRAFADGQLVVERGAALVASASALIVPWDDHAHAPAWTRITGDGTLATHDASGRTLHVAEILFDPQARHDAVFRPMAQALRRVCRSLNLRRIIAAVRLPGYGSLERVMSPEDYAARVVWGTIAEEGLTAPLAAGFQLCGIARGYRPEDSASCGHAALVAWINPLFSPPEPPANVDRSRKCA